MQLKNTILLQMDLKNIVKLILLLQIQMYNRLLKNFASFFVFTKPQLNNNSLKMYTLS